MMGFLNKLRKVNSSKKTKKGCFTVYVGPEKQRFTVKAEYANHPLFAMLLEEAASEFGYRCHGPIVLPCDVDFFYKVVAEMDAGSDDKDDNLSNPKSVLTYLSPTIWRMNKRDHGDGSRSSTPYSLLSPPRSLQ